MNILMEVKAIEIVQTQKAETRSKIIDQIIAKMLVYQL